VFHPSGNLHPPVAAIEVDRDSLQGGFLADLKRHGRSIRSVVQLGSIQEVQCPSHRLTAWSDQVEGVQAVAMSASQRGRRTAAALCLVDDFATTPRSAGEAILSRPLQHQREELTLSMGQPLHALWLCVGAGWSREAVGEPRFRP